MTNRKVFVTSDTHFGHAGMCRFLRPDGSKFRPWDDVDEMNEALISRWNEVVAPKDKVYHLGDFAMNRRYLSVAERLNGRKVLVMGNHDIFRAGDYLKHFEDVKGAVVKDNAVLTHLPVAASAFEYRYKLNIHGHTHVSRVTHPDGSIDKRYRCVCVEQTNYYPVEFSTIIASDQ
jgi:calcineurin-like phosphoesterase family protein